MKINKKAQYFPMFMVLTILVLSALTFSISERQDRHKSEEFKVGQDSIELLKTIDEMENIQFYLTYSLNLANTEAKNYIKTLDCEDCEQEYEQKLVTLMQKYQKQYKSQYKPIDSHSNLQEQYTNIVKNLKSPKIINDQESTISTTYLEFPEITLPTESSKQNTYSRIIMLELQGL